MVAWGAAADGRLMPADVAVIIPVLNEPHIADFVAEVRAVMARAALPCDVLVVNDGDPVRLPSARVLEGSHRGKGRAIRDGIRACEAAIIILLDGDLEVLIPRLPEFVRLVMDDGFDVVIAERDPDFHARNPIRFVLSYGLLLLQRFLMFNSFRFTDTQCGLKAFRGAAARAIAERQRVDGGMYDIEYLYAAVRNRMRVAQVAVGAVAETRPSRIDVTRCLCTDPPALLATKWRGLTGHYRIGNLAGGGSTTAQGLRGADSGS